MLSEVKTKTPAKFVFLNKGYIYRFMFSLPMFLSKNKAISAGIQANCAISHDLQTQPKQQC